MAVLFITHDFGVVAEIADRVVVLQEGSVVEEGPVATVSMNPSTLTPDVSSRRCRRSSRLLQGLFDGVAVPSSRGLSKTFAGRTLFGTGREVRAVADVGFTIRRGETLGLVGESGSGKSTVGRCVLRLIEPIRAPFMSAKSRSRICRRPLCVANAAASRWCFRTPMPRSTRGARSVASSPRVRPHRASTRRPPSRTRRLLDLVGPRPGGRPVSTNSRAATPAHRHRPGARSRARGARRGRAGLRPRRVRAGADLELIRELQDRLGVAILFITHDLAVAAQVCDRIAVMRKGRIVETQDTAGLFASPQHPYTQQLLAAAGAGRLFSDRIRDERPVSPSARLRPDHRRRGSTGPRWSRARRALARRRAGLRDDRRRHGRGYRRGGAPPATLREVMAPHDRHGTRPLPHEARGRRGIRGPTRWRRPPRRATTASRCARREPMRRRWRAISSITGAPPTSCTATCFPPRDAFRRVERVPHGVTGHIVPWNYPMQILGRSVGAALAAGNACVVKPAEDASLTILHVAALARRWAFPDGALNVVTGLGPSAGAALAAHPGIDFLSFTGAPRPERRFRRPPRATMSA